MPDLAVEHDRPISDDGVEVGTGRPAPLGPFVLVPAAAHDPASRLRVLGAPGHALHALSQRPGAAKLDPAEREAQAQEMNVRVDQARYGRATLQVDDIRV